MNGPTVSEALVEMKVWVCKQQEQAERKRAVAVPRSEAWISLRERIEVYRQIQDYLTEQYGFTQEECDQMESDREGLQTDHSEDKHPAKDGFYQFGDK